jgi:hypothetical protein
LLVDIYRELLMKVGGFKAESCTTSDLLSQQNRYHNTTPRGVVGDVALTAAFFFAFPSTRQGDTPLHLACSIPGMVVAVQWLLQNGAEYAHSSVHSDLCLLFD